MKKHFMLLQNQIVEKQVKKKAAGSVDLYKFQILKKLLLENSSEATQIFEMKNFKDAVQLDLVNLDLEKKSKFVSKEW